MKVYKIKVVITLVLIGFLNSVKCQDYLHFLRNFYSEDHRLIADTSIQLTPQCLDIQSGNKLGLSLMSEILMNVNYPMADAVSCNQGLILVTFKAVDFDSTGKEKFIISDVTLHEHSDKLLDSEFLVMKLRKEFLGKFLHVSDCQYRDILFVIPIRFQLAKDPSNPYLFKVVKELIDNEIRITYFPPTIESPHLHSRKH